MLEASRQFGMTQSAVSQAVRRAEASVGVAFFNRSRRPLTPTRAGRILAGRVLDLNRDFEALLSALRAAAEQSERVDLRLGLVNSYAATVGAHLVKELMTGVDRTKPVGMVGPCSLSCGSVGATHDRCGDHMRCDG